MGIWHSPFLYGDCMKPGCTVKSNTNNLSVPTNLTDNPYGKKNLFLKVHLKNRLTWLQSIIEIAV